MSTRKTPPPAIEDEVPADEAPTAPTEPVVRHPDGWYWIARDGQQEFGPFDTREEAIADLHAADAEDLEVEAGDALREAEDELGIADFIDPDTGEPAEGLSNPHLPRDD
ncbi:MAG: hypothetical protein HYZ20_18810 [Burkholderiales bacterium]|nr:hypothetical protein [Burkholderiales bacterium]